ncbi:hypothetical protein PFISCL1PPCAC_27506, partial [Pristionchus fissidentatus]
IASSFSSASAIPTGIGSTAARSCLISARSASDTTAVYLSRISISFLNSSTSSCFSISFSN